MSAEATQSVTVYELLAWLETNKKPLIIAFAAAVVVGFAVGIYRYNSDRKELEASDALLKLKASLTENEALPHTEPSAYLKVAEAYPGTTAAGRALLLAAGALFADGHYAEAQSQFAKFARDHAQSPFASTATLGVAAALEAQGKREEALAAYQNLSVQYPNSAVLDNAKLAVARIYESKNQPEQALRHYEELIKPGAVGGAYAEATARKEALLLKHPELAKTNAPAAATAATIVTKPGTNLQISIGTNMIPAQP